VNRFLAVRSRSLGVALLLAGCSQEVPHRKGELPLGVVAELGGLTVRAETVERIASAQHLSVSAALSRALDDALFSLEASARHEPATRSVIERGALARALLEAFERDARDRGPATDAEIEAVTRARWVELDRPAAVRVTHAVAVAKNPGEAVAARRKAEAIARAVAGIRDPAEFIKAARAVPPDGVEVHAERLPYIAADGRGFVLEREPAVAGEYDRRFAAAANAIQKLGEQSSVVESDFGYHVILLEERVPERRISLADRRGGLRSEIVSRRANTYKRELLEQLSASSRIEIRRDFEALSGALAK
jgi:hypothetical protein